MTTTPVSLLERLKKPADQEAWSRFVDLYTPLIYSWGRRVGLQDAAAADLVQDVLTLLIQKLPEFRYDQHKSFRAWLKTVTLNKWRENSRRPGVRPMPAVPLADLAGQEDSEAFWEREYRQHVLARTLQLIQHDFQPATWNACLEIFSGRSAVEVAKERGLNVGAVRAAKCRVLARLRQELAGLLE